MSWYRLDMANGYSEEGYVPEWKVQREKEERIERFIFYVLGGVFVAAGLATLLLPEVIRDYIPGTEEVSDKQLRTIGVSFTSFGAGIILGNRIRW